MKPNRKEEIHGWLSWYRQKGIALLQKLVQVNSTQGNEKAAQDIILEELKEIGLKIDVWEPDGEELMRNPYFASPRVEFQGSPNVVGILKGAGQGRSIILNGHVDVVPEGDRKHWNDEPYSGNIIDGKMYGRGVTDMKGGNVSLLLAIKAIVSLNIQLKGDVIFQSVVEEESGGAGTLATVLRGYMADAAIIPEPTNMKVFLKQQGSLWFRIHVKGRSAHGGTRYEGISAIEKSSIVLKYMERLEEFRNAQVADELYENIPIPFPINIGRIHGGEWPSSVPDYVVLEGRMGVAPSETIEEAKKEMEKWILKLKHLDPWFEQNPLVLEWFGARWLPGSISKEHDLTKILESTFRSVRNQNPMFEAAPWGTDGGLLTEVGNIPTIVFGPGVTEVAHFSNEYIVLDRVFEAAEIIALTILEWCGIQE